MTSIVWFRRDLRLGDNPALTAAAAHGPVMPVFVLDEVHARMPGGASRWWLHHSLAALRDRLGGLLILRGDPIVVLPGLAAEHGASGVYWNRCYDPQSIARDKALKATLRDRGLTVDTFNAGLLHEPWEVQTGGGGPYKVFSPFWRAARGLDVPAPLPAPEVSLADLPAGEDLDLLPSKPNWAEGWQDIWMPGEAGAMERLTCFLDSGLAGYGTLRNRPDLPNVSRLSPHLAHGEIGPRQIWARARMAAELGAPQKDTDKFLAELGWREFSYHLLYHFPQLQERNWRETFDNYPWRYSSTDFELWKKGQTGYPLVDAGMRELWATGYMHNRVRMVVASFLVKHLRLHWSHGERWFWDTLCDADPANNAASWQWVSGCGADAAPYFRIFNPMTQGEKFDPNGNYIRRWCPELAELPDAHLNAPWEAPASVLSAAGVSLGQTYPRPMVDHREARAAALAGYEHVKATG